MKSDLRVAKVLAPIFKNHDRIVRAQATTTFASVVAALTHVIGQVVGTSSGTSSAGISR